jgi:hypothetical protein
MVGSLLAGSALAYGLVQRWMPDAPAFVAPPATPTPKAPSLVAPGAAAPSAEPVSVPPPVRRRPPAARSVRSARAQPTAAPALAAPAGLPSWPLADEGPEDGPEIPAAPPPRLSIAREGRREVSLILAGNRVGGKIGDAAVALSIERGHLAGKLGHRNVSLWLRGHDADGEIGGVPVRFLLLDTDTGHQLREGFSVRAALPYGSTRVELTASSLSWSPGCGAALPEVAPGTYQGRCASGAQTRVVLAPNWRRLPALTRLLLLSFFLTERDPAFAPLFGAP